MKPETNALDKLLRPLSDKLLRVGGFFGEPASCKQQFENLHKSLESSRQDLVRRLGEDRLFRFREQALGSVQEGLRGCYYHLGNIRLIEGEMMAVAQRFVNEHGEIPEAPYGFTSSLRPTRLTFEYQAFVFAQRRTLEYFAKSAGAFFKCEVKRIRDIVDNRQLARAEPTELSHAVISKIRTGLEALTDVVPPDLKAKGVRDTLAHWKDIPAGHFYIVYRPGKPVLVGLAGGGEKLPYFQIPENETRIASLSATLQDQIERVQALVFGTYSQMGFGFNATY